MEPPFKTKMLSNELNRPLQPFTLRAGRHTSLIKALRLKSDDQDQFMKDQDQFMKKQDQFMKS